VHGYIFRLPQKSRHKDKDKKSLLFNLQNSLFMSMLRRKFSKEQKLELVKESLEESVVIEELASRYKIHAKSIYKWRIQTSILIRLRGGSFTSVILHTRYLFQPLH
jgi:hypothetical protein